MYLNVYVPPGTTNSSGKAVMYWIFGGNLAFGTGGLDFYDGSVFATNQDVIVVTPNYRTNGKSRRYNRTIKPRQSAADRRLSTVFGFPGAPQLKAPFQNPGYLDQRFALDWVQKNIKAFGGDPAKVTIFGESAGGYSVKQLIANPPSPLSFRGAIMESEAALNSGNGTASWEELVFGIGCGSATDQLACVRSKPATQIQSYNQQAGLSYFPMSDGATQTTDVRPNINAGTAAKVPFMIGSNRDEIRVFSWLLGLDPEENASVATLLAYLFPTNPALQKTLSGLIGGRTAYEESATILTAFAFQCPAAMLATFAQGKGYKVHRYLYDAAFPNEALFPDPGVWHSVEIPSVFGTYPEKNAIGSATPRQRKVSSYMNTAWGNFAKKLQPGLGWPELGAGKVQNLGGGKSTGGYTIDASSIDQMCAVFNPIIAGEGL